MDKIKLRISGIVIVSILGMALCAGSVAAASTTDVSVTPTNQSINPGDTATYDIVVDEVDEGVSSYDINVSVANTEAAEITDGEIVGGSESGSINSIELSSDNSQMRIKAGNAGHSDGTIARVNVTAGSEAAGLETNVSTSVSALADTNFQAYTVAETNPAVVSVSSAADSDEPDEFSGVTLSTSPSTTSVPNGSTATVDINIANATQGVESVDFTVSVGDTSVAEITDVSINGQTTTTDIADDGSSAGLTAAAGNPTDDGVIGTVTVKGVSAQNTTLSFSDVILTDTNLTEYSTQTQRGVLAISEDTGPTEPIGNADTAPGNVGSDVDGYIGEDVYEDVNGDGSVNIIDVSLFLKNYEEETIQNNKAAFDYNGDGSVNIIDLTVLLRST